LSCPMALISRAKGIERAATAVRSLPGKSVQPDVPIFISPSPSSRAGAFFAHAEVSLLHVVFS